jgi:hypothetical protein
LDILHNLFKEILIPPAIEQEFLAAQHEARLQVLQEAHWIRVVAIQDASMVEALADLDRGEAEVLALAHEQNARLVLVDEKKARRYAERMKFRLSGTLGVVLLAKEEGVIEKVSPIIDALQETGLHLHDGLVKQILLLAGEAS